MLLILLLSLFHASSQAIEVDHAEPTCLVPNTVVPETLMQLGSSPTQTPKLEMCETVKTHKFQIRRAGAVPLIQKKMGIFCATPILTTKGRYLSSCDDGEMRFLDAKGKLLKAFNIDKAVAGEEQGIAQTRVAPIPGTTPQMFVATRFSLVNKMILFDDTGKIYPAQENQEVYEPSIPQVFGEKVVVESDGSWVEVSKDGTVKQTELGISNPSDFEISGDKAVMTDDKGNIHFVSSEGKILKTLNLSKTALSSPAIAPDGKVWTANAQGKWYIIDVNNYDFTAITPNYLQASDVGFASRYLKPVFFADGTIAIGVSNLTLQIKDKPSVDINQIYFLNGDYTLRAVYDAVLNRKKNDPAQSTSVSYPRDMYAKITVTEGESTREALWVGTIGGHFVMNLQGEVLGNMQFSARDAETLDYPLQNKDQSYYLGLYNGMDRFKIAPGTQTFKTIVLKPCKK